MVALSIDNNCRKVRNVSISIIEMQYDVLILEE